MKNKIVELEKHELFNAGLLHYSTFFLNNLLIEISPILSPLASLYNILHNATPFPLSTEHLLLLLLPCVLTQKTVIKFGGISYNYKYKHKPL